MNNKILVIDDEVTIRITFEDFLKEEGYEVTTAKNFEEGVQKLEEEHFDVIFSDINLGEKTGIDLLNEVSQKVSDTPIIMVTGYPTVETATEALRLGVFDYISKPVRKPQLLEVAAKAVHYKTLIEENRKTRSNLNAIFRSVQDAIVTVDKNLVVSDVNEAIQNISGYSPEELLGKEFEEKYIGCEQECFNTLKGAIRSGESKKLFRVECINEKDNSKKILSITASPLIDDKDECIGGVLVLRDETRLDKREEIVSTGDRKKFHNIVGQSREMQRIYSMIQKLADIPTTVLITGESGTGKELIVDAIHHTGKRKNSSIVKVNCAALSEELLESELFGHVKGAFTGAINEKIGRFKKADGGTIFLDEIGDISRKTQLRLLRVLQEREFERVGDSTSIKVDVRVIAATNADLLQKVEDGSFREDLYYRLKVIQIKLPPLRERKQDLMLLTEHLINVLNTKLDKNVSGISKDVEEFFLNYQWPGNIRELEHSIEHAIVLSDKDIIEVDYLPESILNYKEENRRHRFKSKDDEPQHILDALEQAKGNKTKAAKLLGINRRTLYRKMHKFSLEDKEN